MAHQIILQIFPMIFTRIFDFSLSSFLSLGYSIIIGLIIGILINYLSDVLPATRNLSRPTCEGCGQAYKLKTYLFLQKCPNCDHKKSARSFMILLAAAICSVLLRIFPFYTLGYWETLPILLFLGVIIVIDIEHHIVLIQTSLVGIILLFVYGSLMHGFITSLYGGLGGLLITLGFFLLGIIFTKVLGRLRGKLINQVAFGLGDVFAGLFLGFLAGWPAIIGGIIAGILVFGAYSLIFLIVLISSKRYRAFASPQPFTPFLILGVLIIFYL